MTSFPDQGRLQRFSNVMVIVTSVGMVLIAAATVLAFVVPEWTRNLMLARLGEAGRDLPLTPGRIAAGAAITAVPVGVLLFGLWQVRALFADFGVGRVFTLTSASRLRNFAASVLAQAVLGPVSSTALLLAFTLDNPPGRRQVGIALSTNDCLALIVGGVLLAIAWVMLEATRIADEHASFV